MRPCPRRSSEQPPFRCDLLKGLIGIPVCQRCQVHWTETPPDSIADNPALVALGQPEPATRTPVLLNQDRVADPCAHRGVAPEDREVCCGFRKVYTCGRQVRGVMTQEAGFVTVIDCDACNLYE